MRGSRGIPRALRSHRAFRWRRCHRGSWRWPWSPRELLGTRRERLSLRSPVATVLTHGCLRGHLDPHIERGLGTGSGVKQRTPPGPIPETSKAFVDQETLWQRRWEPGLWSQTTGFESQFHPLLALSTWAIISPLCLQLLICSLQYQYLTGCYENEANSAWHIESPQ